MTLSKHCRCFLLACLASTLLFTHLIADELEPVSLKLKWRHQFQFAGYYAAIEKGFYRDAGFDVTLLEHSGESDLFSAVTTGDIEFGVADSSIVLKRLQGLPLVILTPIYQHSPLVLMSLKEKGILSPFELIGKRVMYRKNSDDAAILAMLTSMGIVDSDYELVPHNFNNFALLETEPTVDVMAAYLSNQPALYQNLGYEVQVIDPANYGIDFYGDLLYSSEKYVSNNPDKAIAFKDASLKGWAYALENPDEVISWLLDEEKYPANKSLGELQYEAEITRNMIAPDFVKLGSAYAVRFERIANIYRQLELAPSNSTLSGLLLADYLEQEANNTRQMFKVIAIIIVVLLVLIAILVLGLRSLRNTIRKRTVELNSLNDILLNQLSLTDQYVISATLDLNDRFTEVSAALCDISGYSREELLQMDPGTLTPQNAKAGRIALSHRVFAGHSEQGDMRQIHKNGSYYWLHLYADPVRSSDGSITGIRLTASDITERKIIERLSETDGLTGIANRKKIDNVLAIEWARYLRYKQEVSVILLDLDLFKQINDKFGHSEGDHVLKQVAMEISKCIRNIDLVGRWGGEEFMVILPQTKLADAANVAEKLRVAVSQIESIAHLNITASFGVASSTQVTEIETLFRFADKALYSAKTKGRNCVEIAS